MGLITAVILTKNEAQNLERCFASLRWCAEIVVVDSGSTDGTQARARELGARVLERELKPFLAVRQRNWVLENGGITTPWVLFMDADEAVPTQLAEALVRFCGSPGTDVAALELTPRYLFWGCWLRRTQGYPNWHPRVFRVGVARLDENSLWEQFAPGFKVGRLHEPYDHFANSKGFSDWLERHDRYSGWDAQKIVDFLEAGDPEKLGTTRKLKLRTWAARWWPLRPWARFAQMYFFRLGFLEGRAAFVFCLLYFFYEWMTVIKTVELLRRRRGLPL
jgi:glycosyltransferase involved in cell wall biosynthesis